MARNRHTGFKLLGILVGWVVLFFALKGENTRALSFQDTNGLHRKLNEARDWVQLDGKDNWFFGGVLGTVGDFLNWAFESVQELVSVAALPTTGARDRVDRPGRHRGLRDLRLRRDPVHRSWSPCRC